MNACLKCSGKYESWRAKCPFCDAAEQRKLGHRTNVKLTQDERVYNFYPSMIEEYERMKTIQTPAAFKGEKPDTPEAAAARRQMEISKGKDVPNVPRA